MHLERLLEGEQYRRFSLTESTLEVQMVILLLSPSRKIVFAFDNILLIDRFVSGFQIP